jgi:hypothetical protein
MAQFAKCIADYPAFVVQPVFPIGTGHKFVLAFGLMGLKSCLHLTLSLAPGACQIVHLQWIFL